MGVADSQTARLDLRMGRRGEEVAVPVNKLMAAIRVGEYTHKAVILMKIKQCKVDKMAVYILMNVHNRYNFLKVKCKWSLAPSSNESIKQGLSKNR